MERFLRGFSHDFECTSSRKKYANCREHIVLKIKTGEGESVEFEVKRALASPDDFLDATPASPNYRRQSSGLFRDRPGDTRCAFVVEDGRYVSARWPGDVHLFAQTIAKHVIASRLRRAA